MMGFSGYKKRRGDSGIACVFTFLSVFLSASPLLPGAEESEVIELLHADHSEMRIEKDNLIINLIGNVSFRHKTTDLTSDRAVWYRTAGQVVFLGNVNITDGGDSLCAERITYTQRTERAVADGNVRLRSLKENAEITGDHAEYDRANKYALFSPHPELILYSDVQDSMIRVTSDSMEYFLDSGEGMAKGDVHIAKEKMDVYCEKADLYSKENRIVLKGDPRATQRESMLSGEEMELFFVDKKIERIEVSKDAKVTHRQLADSLSSSYTQSNLSGKKITFLLDDEELKEVRVIENAQSLYHPWSSDSLTKIKNEASGDTIGLFLNYNQVNRVLITGGGEGTYYSTTRASSQDSVVKEDTVKYSAGLIDYRIDQDRITLEKNCNLKYEKISLDAGRIEYYTRNEILVAEGRTVEENGEVKLTDLPVLKEGSEEIIGSRMVYNFSTKRGKIQAGKTGFRGGFYYGDRLRKVEENVILADRGTYTTCDKENPHYHFYSTSMKIIPKDKVITRPVVLYIEEIPVAGIPFYVFPVKPGRHSGFLTFDLGNFEAGERFIRNLGYYWALSDYWDTEASFDFYEKSGWIIKGWGRYAKRYLLNGDIAGSYNRESRWSGLTRVRRDRWDFTFRHNHNVSPSTRLYAYGTFLSDKSYYQDFSFDPWERRNRSLKSQLSLNTKFLGAGIYLALNRNQDLDRDTRVHQFPVMNVTFPSFHPFGYSQKVEERRWYHPFYLSYGVNFLNYNYKSKTDAGYDKKEYLTADNSINLTFPQRILGEITLSPNLNFQETWYYVLQTNLSQNKGVKAETFARRDVPSFSLSSSTNLYGTFYPRIGKINGLRHVISPNVSFSWHPEVTKSDVYQNFTGKGGSGRKARSLNFSLSHLFQLRTEDQGKVKKFELFNLNSNASYNFMAKTRKWSYLTSGLRSNAIPGIDLGVTLVHDLYNEETSELDWTHPRLINFSLSTGLQYRGGGVVKKKGIDLSSGQEKETVQEKRDWGFYLSHRYSESRSGGKVFKTHWASLSADLWLTKNWHLNYLDRYDFEDEKITEQTFELYRDMHCWEGRFTWVLQGYRQGYYFRINIKALPEVKIEKSRGGLREMFF
jgi:lipopolysaccharide assembly outer membrane protein LptD (OstA)